MSKMYHALTRSRDMIENRKKRKEKYARDKMTGDA